MAIYIFVMYTFSTTTIDIERAKLSNYTCETYVRDSNSLVILKFSIDAPHVCWVCFLWCVHFQLLYVVISPHSVSIAKFASCSAEDISLSLSKIFTDSLYASAVLLKKTRLTYHDEGRHVHIKMQTGFLWSQYY